MSRTIVGLCLGLVAAVAVRAGDDPDLPKKPPAGYTQWFFAVACADDANAAVVAAADRLKKVLQNPIALWKAKKNPGCCFWIRLEEWMPNPGKDGYVIIVQPGGAQLLAASAKSLEAAIDHIDKVKVVRDGKVFVPLGLMTSYDIAAAQAK